MPERLQKIMARAGVASRRAAEDLIKQGRVRVNGRVAQLGESALETDSIVVNGKEVTRATEHVTFALYKPRGIVTTADDELGRKNVLHLVPVVPGLHPIGRLDRDSEGLLLLTTDGDLTLQLTHPRYEHPKEYRIWSEPAPTKAQLELLRRGVNLEDGLAKADSLREAEGGAIIVIREGRNRQVRRMFGAIGLEVVVLKRTRVSNLHLGDLRVGEWRELEAEEVAQLRAPFKREKYQPMQRPDLRRRSQSRESRD